MAVITKPTPRLPSRSQALRIERIAESGQSDWATISIFLGDHPIGLFVPWVIPHNEDIRLLTTLVVERDEFSRLDGGFLCGHFDELSCVQPC